MIPNLELYTERFLTCADERQGTAVLAVGVIDRSVCFGWNGGHLLMELKAALFDAPSRPIIRDFIGGLANTDITVQHLKKAVDLTYRALQGERTEEVTWLSKLE